jgi:hypothetical protein
MSPSQVAVFREHNMIQKKLRNINYHKGLPSSGNSLTSIASDSPRNSMDLAASKGIPIKGKSAFGSHIRVLSKSGSTKSVYSNSANNSHDQGASLANLGDESMAKSPITNASPITHNLSVFSKTNGKEISRTGSKETDSLPVSEKNVK